MKKGRRKGENEKERRKRRRKGEGEEKGEENWSVRLSYVMLGYKREKKNAGNNAES